MEPIYLGDGVYALFEDGYVILRLDRHDNEHGQICLDLEVFRALRTYGNRAFKEGIFHERT